MKRKCWEFKNCGMEPGGMNISEYGPCPIAVELKVDKNDNNCCWLIKSYHSNDGALIGNLACMMPECLACDFYNMMSEDSELFIDE